MTSRRPRGVRTRRLWILALTLLLMGASAGNSAAELPETERQARRLFESAEAHFRGGLFAEALAEYQAGYDIHPLPGFLINIAQCHRRLGNLSVAQATYRKFIMVAPDSPFVPQVKALMAELDSLNQDLAGNSEATPESASPKAAEEPAPAASPDPEPVSSTTPAAVVLVSQPPVEPPRAKKRWWLWGAIGAAAVGAITTVVLLSLPPEKKTVHDGSLGTLRR